MKAMDVSEAKVISLLCSLGLFLAGYIFYTSSTIEPFYAADFNLSSWQIGMAQSAVPIGAILGAILAGWLADFLGRRSLLVFSFLSLSIVAILGGLSFDFYSLFLTRAMNGFLAGTLYPLCAAYLIEMTPNASLARQSAILMFVNCSAAPIGCLLALLLSCFFIDSSLWRLLAACHALPAFMAYCWARKLPESKAWLALEKKSDAKLLDGIKTLFNPSYKKMTLCLMSIWFLMDVAYYGINFFVPYLLQAMQVKSLSASFDAGAHSLLTNETVWGSLIISLFFSLGAFSAIYIIEKCDLIKLQKMGFLLAAMSLFCLATYFYLGLYQAYMIILLFILFNFALNAGPDVTTYLLSATSYPVEIRGCGHGLVAGFAKLGSVLGVLFLPKLQEQWGVETVIMTLSFLLFAAYFLTNHLRAAMLKDNTLTEASLNYETR
jgi:MFS family permease